MAAGDHEAKLVPGGHAPLSEQRRYPQTSFDKSMYEDTQYKSNHESLENNQMKKR